MPARRGRYVEAPTPHISLILEKRLHSALPQDRCLSPTGTITSRRTDSKILKMRAVLKQAPGGLSEIEKWDVIELLLAYPRHGGLGNLDQVELGDELDLGAE